MSQPVTLETRTAVGELHHDSDGSLHGWCWYPDEPMLRATVELLRDGQVVRAVRATRPISDLRERGMGDGHCGFWFSQPPGVSPQGPRVVLDVRERRLGITIGRVIIGSGDGSSDERLQAARKSVARAAAALDTISSGSDPAAMLGTLGRSLLHMARTPGGQTALGPHGLRACLQQVEEVPAADLNWCAHPRLSVIVTARGDLLDLAARIHGAAHVLRGTDVEFLLIEDGSVPLAPLLPTRLNGLMFVQTPAWSGRGAALNAAAATARGEVLAIVRPGGPGLAELAGVSLDPVSLGLDAGLIPRLAEPGPLRHHRLDCVVRRTDLAAMGGFDPWSEEAEMWCDLLQKAQALGLSLQTWSALQATCLPERTP